jgi:hypothetical protein
MGGSGKTALAQQFVRQLLETDQPDGLLVWSFYDDPDANAFLKCAYGYFTGNVVGDAKGAGWFHLLKEALDGSRKFLLVLDGLERVQRARTDATGIYGELEDPLLRGLLVRLASSHGRGKTIITTRFPLADIERIQGADYSFIDINRLDPEASNHLLKVHGCQGTDSELYGLGEKYGFHALTIDLLGGAVNRFMGGDFRRAPTPVVSGTKEEAQAQRLSSVLEFYEQGLSKQENDLLSRLCVFRFGVDPQTLGDVFLSTASEDVTGTLAGMDTANLERLLSGLVTAHLVHAEEDGRYTVHPAVRDHFYRLFRDSKAVHGAVSKHLLSLSDRPGIGLPTDKGALDLLEELVYHAISAGNVDQALDIYLTRLGGNQHLNATLGEYGRTFRILQAFPECPDSGAMYLCLRAFGDLEGALRWRPQNRYILLGTGRLEELRAESSERTGRAARFLQGEDVAIPDRLPDFPLCSAYMYLLKGATLEAERLAAHDIEVSLYQDDVVRNQLVLVDSARRRGSLDQASERLEAITLWVLNSGSQEHLAMLSLLRARLSLDLGKPRSALYSIEEGLQVARDCGYRLIGLELLLEEARVRLVEKTPESAIHAAEAAMRLATHPDIRFFWGELNAAAALAEAHVLMGMYDEARRFFAQFQTLHRRTRELRFQDVERRLASSLTGLGKPT